MIEIIPSIDIMGGRCVRLKQGDFSKEKVYKKDPLAIAKKFESEGARRLHLVDLDGVREGRIINYYQLERIARQTRLVVDFGGGIKTDNDIRIAFNSGARMVTAGSVAVLSKEKVIKWLSIFGADRIILGADTRNGKIVINGWKTGTEQYVITFIKEYQEAGIRKVICTSIEKDGMMEGPAFHLYGEIISHCGPLELIASGGITHPGDIEKLDSLGVSGAIIGKALYENKIKLKKILN